MVSVVISIRPLPQSQAEGFVSRLNESGQGRVGWMEVHPCE